LGHVVEHRRDHVHLMYDLPNGTILTQKVVASSVFQITKILAIEDDKFDNTFLYIIFGSQNLLEPISDQIGTDINWSTGESDQRKGE
jgi:hypothetical protein